MPDCFLPSHARRYDDNFVGEGLRPVFRLAQGSPGDIGTKDKEKVISRMDASLVAVLSLISDASAGASFRLDAFTKDRDWRDVLG